MVGCMTVNPTLELEMVVCNVVPAHLRAEALQCSSVKDALRSSSDKTKAAVKI